MVGGGDDGADFKTRGVASESSKEIGEAVLRKQTAVRAYVGYKHLVKGANEYKDTINSLGLRASNGVGGVSLVSAQAELAQ